MPGGGDDAAMTLSPAGQMELMLSVGFLASVAVLIRAAVRARTPKGRTAAIAALAVLVLVTGMMVAAVVWYVTHLEFTF